MRACLPLVLSSAPWTVSPALGLLLGLWKSHCIHPCLRDLGIVFRAFYLKNVKPSQMVFVNCFTFLEQSLSWKRRWLSRYRHWVVPVTSVAPSPALEERGTDPFGGPQCSWQLLVRKNPVVSFHWNGLGPPVIAVFLGTLSPACESRAGAVAGVGLDSGKHHQHICCGSLDIMQFENDNH